MLAKNLDKQYHDSWARRVVRSRDYAFQFSTHRWPRTSYLGCHKKRDQALCSHYKYLYVAQQNTCPGTVCVLRASYSTSRAQTLRCYIQTQEGWRLTARDSTGLHCLSGQSDPHALSGPSAGRRVLANLSYTPSAEAHAADLADMQACSEV